MREIPLTQGMITTVDDEDFERLNQYKWNAHRSIRWHGLVFYAVRKKSGKTVQMHREILNAPKGEQVDHIDGNGLNNQKSNLRIVTTRQNQQNLHYPKSSQYPGVSWDSYNNKWQVNIQVKGKLKKVGRFTTEIEAYESYKNAVKQTEE